MIKITKRIKAIALACGMLALSTAALGTAAYAATDTETETPAATESVAPSEDKDSDSRNTDSSTGATEKRSRSGKGGRARVNVISVAAEVLGQTEDEVKEYVMDGKVGDLLVQADKVDEFKEAYLAKAKEKLDAAVADESMTQDEADEKYAAYEEKMANYDGTEHLCGQSDHSRMKEKQESTSSES